MSNPVWQNTSIFARPTAPSPKPAFTSIALESQEFDASTAMLDSLMIQETIFMQAMMEHTAATHIALQDDNMEILTEGMGDMMKSAVQFFVNLGNKFKEMMRKLFMYLEAYFGSFEKFVKKHKDELRTRTPNFSIHGYKYTTDTLVPDVSKVQDIVVHFNTELNGIKDLDMKKLSQDRQAFTSDDSLDRLRGNMIGTTPIRHDAYVSELKKFFRNGQSETVELQVDQGVLQSALDSYEALSKRFKEVKAERDKTVSLISSLKTFFERGAAMVYDGPNKTVSYGHVSINDTGSGIKHGDKLSSSYTDETYRKINMFYNFKYVQAKELGGMTVTAMIEKVTAIKDELKQMEHIVKRSLGKASEVKHDTEAN